MEEFKGIPLRYELSNKGSFYIHIYQEGNSHPVFMTCETSEERILLTETLISLYNSCVRTGLTPEQMEKELHPVNLHAANQHATLHEQQSTISDLEARLKEACELIDEIDFASDNWYERREAFLTKEKTK